jgi:hypothetical protein
MEVLFGVQRQSPGGGLGAKPPAAELFFSESDCGIKTGWGGDHQWKNKGGGGRAAVPSLHFFKGGGAGLLLFC